VVKNLNVLDHEHYFAITDHLLNGDAPGALLAFNDVLFQGFDGHLFVAGLARHFRDLLVCQDARTIALMEVGQDLAARYADQAARTNMAQLVAGLDRTSTVDTLYKSSKEPRLLVETALIQLARDWAGKPAAQVNVPQPAPLAEKKKPDAGLTAKQPEIPSPEERAVPPPPVSASEAPRAPSPPLEAVSAPTAAPERTAKRLASSISIREHLAPAAKAEETARLADIPGNEPET
jgi:DNA polymerase-3 subunit gamma/tau